MATSWITNRIEIAIRVVGHIYMILVKKNYLYRVMRVHCGI